MKNSQKLILGIITILILGAIGLIGYTFVQQRNEQRVADSMAEVAALPDRTEDVDIFLDEDTSEVLKSAEFESVSFYKTSGGVSFERNQDQFAVVLGDDFEFGTRAPDPVMYLCEDSDPSDIDDCVILGALQNSTGEQAWEITETESNQYNNVILWCRAFGVLMGTSSLN